MKPILIGEQNPYGPGPEFALYPAPDGCAGHRLCCLILGMHRRDYMEVFDRVNLCEGPWVKYLARRAADELVKVPRPLILLGNRVATAFGIEPIRPFTFNNNRTMLLLPHPSGRCRLWNQVGAIQRARRMVSEMCPDIAHLIGAAT